MNTNPWGEKTQFFNDLDYDAILNSLEALGLKTSGRVIQLASMENRVYEVEKELDCEPDNPSDKFWVAKFYRPGRWSREQIQDEHDFLFDLQQQEIPVIAPHKIDGQSLFQNNNGLFFTIFPRQGGRAQDEWTEESLQIIGRTIARLHNIGSVQQAEYRIQLNPDTFIKSNLDYLLDSTNLLIEYKKSYEDLSSQIYKMACEQFKNIKNIRIHGDCHHGNIINNRETLFLIDFDDMYMGPAVQDLWMIAPGRDSYAMEQRNILINSYCEMRDFNFQELKMIETLRAMRMIHFSAWIGKRFTDQSFQRAFPNYGTHQYWNQEVESLRDQVYKIQDNI